VLILDHLHQQLLQLDLCEANAVLESHLERAASGDRAYSESFGALVDDVLARLAVRVSRQALRACLQGY